ncbi:MAG TPA: putative baseplate assembly protein [Bryobacteraceae bacterium]|jgi:predicted phage baseplate assembly protein|nr:putative baseplate assembly protein [Bryobacteraceae bacterium]
MPLPNIVLDDRTYDDLTAELQRRIPAYTPEWTDFNESDPGIALIELFAWLAELLVYRVNQIPDNAYVKFLQMIGIQLNLPAAAQTYLTFTLTSSNLPTAVTIPGQTQVSLSNSSGGAPVIFETTDNLNAVGASLVAVQYFDGTRYTVVNNFNPTDGTSYPVFGPQPQAGCALYLGFDGAYPADPAEEALEYPLTILVATVGGGDVQGGPQNLQNLSPPINGVLEYWNGTTWQSVTIVTDGTKNLTQNGVIMFNAPSGWTATLYGALKKSSDTPLFWMRYRIAQVLGSGYQTSPQLTNIFTNTISAINSVTVQGELIGASNGMPNQTFQISNFPILKDPSSTGIVAVNEGSGYTTWTEVLDFAASGRNDTVYTLDYSTGLVGFGDGVNGKIPHWLSSDGTNRPAADLPNIQVTEYHYGGGSVGNAGPGTITNLEKAIPFVASVTNPVPSQLGADEETVAHAEDRAPLALQTQSRAVSVNDFIYFAKQTPGAGIQRATALPLQRPQTQVVRASDGTVIVPPPAPGVVTVLVVPDGPNPLMPVATAQTLAAVAAYLDQYRLLTCELHISTPVYRLVEIEANVIVNPNALSGQVQTALETTLLNFYNPLTGGQQGTGWDFGGTIYVSDAYGQILGVTGVQRIEGSVKIFVDGVQQPQDQDITLQPFELVYSTNHTLNVSYAQ